MVWNVDDNKLSYIDKEMVTNIIHLMNKYFGDLVVYRGNKHNFLEMNITITSDRNIKIKDEGSIHGSYEQFRVTIGI